MHKENIPVNQMFVSGPKERASYSKLIKRKNLFCLLELLLCIKEECLNW